MRNEKAQWEPGMKTELFFRVKKSLYSLKAVSFLNTRRTIFIQKPIYIALIPPFTDWFTQSVRREVFLSIQILNKFFSREASSDFAEPYFKGSKYHES